MVSASVATIVPSAGGLAPGGMRTISPTSRRSVDTFTILEAESAVTWVASFSADSLSDADEDTESVYTRRASGFLRFPSSVIALEAWCLLNASMKRPEKQCQGEKKRENQSSHSPISKNMVRNATESKYVIDPDAVFVAVGLLLAEMASSAIDEK